MSALLPCHPLVSRLTSPSVRISAGYSSDSIWRNRSTFIQGTDAIIAFLTAKWKREHSYVLRKSLFAFTTHRIAVQFWYEYRDTTDSMRWKRCYGLEDWTYDDSGKMRKRMMSGNDVLLGRDGDGIAVPGEGIMGRWFTAGLEGVEDVAISDEGEGGLEGWGGVENLKGYRVGEARQD
jgi:nuclear transport factor 2 (NTF2) superfamily protein